MDFNTNSNYFNYILSSKKSFPKSTSVFLSDYSYNVLLLEQVVGTLVKENNEGIPSPYLSKKWEVSNNGKTWTFEFKENLYDDESTPITPENYLKSFYRILATLTQESDPPIFKELKGYKEFKKNKKTISGIKNLNNKKIEFNFTHKIDGLLEYLSMPYFGFYSDSNFAGDKWKDDKKIVSSGSYRINSWNENELVLKKRESWPLNNEETMSMIKISSIEKGCDIPKRSSLLFKQEINKCDKEKLIEGFTIPAEVLVAIVSPVSKFFKHKSNRLFLRNKIREYNRITPTNISGTSKADTFFHSEKEHQIIDNNDHAVFHSSGITSLRAVTFIKEDSETLNYAKKILNKSFKDKDIKIIWEHLDHSSELDRKRISVDQDFDIRVGTVYSGSHPDNWIVEMMFCSTLGVSYPDPSGRIKSLVERYKNNLVSKIKYSKELEKIIFEDSSVIPMLHYARRWLATPDIDVDKLSPASSVIRFDLIRLKDD